MPALLNGHMHPIWYQVTKRQTVDMQNVAVQLLEGSGYEIHNLANYMGFDLYWPRGCSHLNIPKGNGIGDPQIIFPYTSDLIKKIHNKESPFFIFS